MRLYTVLLYFCKEGSTHFGSYPHPSSGEHTNCNYNIWHWLNHICYGSTSARCCNYSLHVLLMMDEGTIQNV